MEGFDITQVGSRIRAVRQRADMSQRDLQAETGISQPTLHRLETGVRTTVTLVELDRIAQVLGIPLDDLLHGSRVRARVRAATRAVDGAATDTALDRVVELLELDDRLDAVLPRLRQERPELPVVPPCSGSSEDRGARLAAQVRECLGLGVAPITDLAEVVEELTGVDVGTTPLPQGVSGVCAVDPQRDTTILLVDCTEVAERQRFTLAHELGHVLLGDTEHVHAAVGPGAATRTPAEVRCDAFARNLLAPRPGVRAWLERARESVRDGLVDERRVALLARHFLVSPEVAGIQLDRMKLPHAAIASLPSGRTLAHRYGWGAAYDSEQESAARPRVPRRLLDRATEAFRAGLLGLPVLARLQGKPLSEVDRMLADAGIIARPTVRRADVAALVARAPGHADR